MPLITLISAKGSPGATTTAAALAAVAGPPAPVGGLLIELDPAGGDVELLTGARSGEPSLLAAAADVRREVPPEVLVAHAREVCPGLTVLVAPTEARVAGPVVQAIGARLGVQTAAVTGWVLVDAGRWDPSQQSAGRVDGADVVCVVCRSTAPSIAHARDVLDQLGQRQAAVALVGDEPYGPADVAGVVGVPVLGPMAWDPLGVTDLWTSGATPRWVKRRPFARSAGRLLEDLATLVAPPRHAAATAPVGNGTAAPAEVAW